MSKKNVERTLAIFKPDLVRKPSQYATAALHQITQSHNFRILALKMFKLTPEKARAFYAEHNGKAFFHELVEFMTSGPIVVMVLEGTDAVTRYRKLMGATDPKKADVNTLRNIYGCSITENAVHGSDSVESAEREIGVMFDPEEVFGKGALR